MSDLRPTTIVLDQSEELQQRLLNNLVVRGRHLLHDLEREARKFNVFRILGISDQELKHSNMLAWLSDPDGTHGLGDRFLREFLISITDTDNRSTLDPVDVATARFGDVRVFRERQRLDLLVVIPNSESPMPWILAVENKVNATQSEDQLFKYRKRLEKHYEGAKRLLVFLTKEEEQPDDAGWIPLRYSDVLLALDTAVESVGNSISREPALLLQHYRTILREDFMSELSASNSIEEKCRKIYQEYGDALELLFQYRPDGLTDVSVALGDTIENAFVQLKDDRGGDKRVVKGLVEYIPGAWKDIGFDRDSKDGYVVLSVNLWGKYADLRLLAVGVKDDAWLDRVWDLRGPNLPFETITKRKSRPKDWMTYHSQQLLDGGKPIEMAPIVEGEEDPVEAAQRIAVAAKRLLQTETFQTAYQKTTELLRELAEEQKG
jgi:hypothetical protein